MIFNTYCFIIESICLIAYNVLLQNLQKLRNCRTTSLSLRSVQPKCTSQEGCENTNTLLFQCAASGTLHEDQRTLYCCRRHKFGIKALLGHTQYFYVVQFDKQLNNTYRIHCYVSIDKMVKRIHHYVTLHVHCLSYS